MDFPESADVAVADDDMAALEEVFVGLGVIEAADDGPDHGDGGGDGLDDGGAALVGAHGVGVVVVGVVRDGDRRVNSPYTGLGVFVTIDVAAGGSGGGGGGGGGVGGVDSVKLQRRRHFFFLSLFSL